MIYPEFPKEGSYIGICAPSAGVGFKLDSFDMSLEMLEQTGLTPVETESVRNEDCPSAPAAMRGNEFNELFADDDIDMVGLLQYLFYRRAATLLRAYIAFNMRYGTFARMVVRSVGSTRPT